MAKFVERFMFLLMVVVIIGIGSLLVGCGSDSITLAPLVECTTQHPWVYVNSAGDTVSVPNRNPSLCTQTTFAGN